MKKHTTSAETLLLHEKIAYSSLNIGIISGSAVSDH
jgi:hypothetical protein